MKRRTAASLISTVIQVVNNVDTNMTYWVRASYWWEALNPLLPAHHQSVVACFTKCVVILSATPPYG